MRGILGAQKATRKGAEITNAKGIAMIIALANAIESKA